MGIGPSLSDQYISQDWKNSTTKDFISTLMLSDGAFAEHHFSKIQCFSQPGLLEGGCGDVVEMVAVETLSANTQMRDGALNAILHRLVGEIAQVSWSLPPGRSAAAAEAASALHETLLGRRQFSTGLPALDSARASEGSELLENIIMDKLKEPLTVKSDEEEKGTLELSSQSARRGTELSLNAHVALRLFFQLLDSLKRNQNLKGLLQLTHQIPVLLKEMPPLALNHQGDLSESHQVVHSVTSAVEVLARQPQRLSAVEHAEALGALFALAVKGGSLSRILATLRLILFGTPLPVLASQPLYVTPFLKDLSEATPITCPPLVPEDDGIASGIRYGTSFCSGRLVTFGRAEHGKLGHGAGIEIKESPCLVESLRDVDLTKIVAQSTHCTGLTSAGEVLVWGTGDKTRGAGGDDVYGAGPRVVPFFSTKGVVKDVACGLGHTIVVMATGTVYGWGSGGHGRLGLGDTNDRTHICQIVALEGEDIVSVACGASHSIALGKSGTAFCWGKNSQGQCGKGTSLDQLVPAKVDAEGLSDEKFCSAAGGWEHTLLLTESGKIFSCGGGYKDNRGQPPPVLGHGEGPGPKTRGLSPRQIEPLAKEKVRAIATGWDHCLAVTENGGLYTWGSGAGGKLGHGDLDNRSIPTLVVGLNGQIVVASAGGCDHSMALLADGKCYSWGLVDGGRLGYEVPHEKFQLVPQLVDTFDERGLRAVGVGLGDKFSMVLVKRGPRPPKSLRKGDKAKGLHSAAEKDTASKKFTRDWLLSQPALSIPKDAVTPVSGLAAVLIAILHIERLSSGYLSANWAREMDRLPHQLLMYFNSQNATLSMKDVAQTSLVVPYCVDSAPETIEMFLFLLRGLQRFQGGNGSINAGDLADSLDNSVSLIEISVDSTGGVDWDSLAGVDAKQMGIEGAGLTGSYKVVPWALLWASLRATKASLFQFSRSWVLRQLQLQSKGEDISKIDVVTLEDNNIKDDCHPEAEDPACSNKAMNPQPNIEKEDNNDISFGEEKENSTPEVQKAIWESLDRGGEDIMGVRQRPLNENLQDLRDLLEQFLDDSQLASMMVKTPHEGVEAVQAEAAEALSAGFRLFYPSLSCRIKLLRQITSGEKTNPCLVRALTERLAQDEYIAEIVHEACTKAPGNGAKATLFSLDELEAMLSDLLTRSRSGYDRLLSGEEDELASPTKSGESWASASAKKSFRRNLVETKEESTEDEDTAIPKPRAVECIYLKLLLPLQTSLLSELAGLMNKGLVSPHSRLREAAWSHVENCLSQAETSLSRFCQEARGGANIYRLAEVTAESFLGRGIPLLCSALTVFPAEMALPVRLLPLGLKLLHTLQSTLQKFGSSGVGHLVMEPHMEWLLDLEASVALLASRLAVILIEGPNDRGSEEDTAGQWCSQLSLLGAGPQNWPANESAGLEQLGIEYMTAARTLRWKEEGVFKEVNKPPLQEKDSSSTWDSRRGSRSTMNSSHHSSRGQLLPLHSFDPQVRPGSRQKRPQSPVKLEALGRNTTPQGFLRTVINQKDLSSFLKDLVAGKGEGGELHSWMLLQISRGNTPPSSASSHSRLRPGSSEKFRTPSKSLTTGSWPFHSTSKTPAPLYSTTAPMWLEAPLTPGEVASDGEAAVRTEVEATLRALTALLLKANNLVQEAAMFAKCHPASDQMVLTGAIAPPPVLVVVWTTAFNLCNSLLAKVEKGSPFPESSIGNDDKADEFDAKRKEHAAAALAGAKDKTRWLLQAAELPPIELAGSGAEALSDGSTQPPESPGRKFRRWSRNNPRANARTVQDLYMVLMNWKKRAPGNLPQHMQSNDAQLPPDLICIAEFLANPDVTPQKVQLAMHARALRAKVRAVGLQLLRYILSLLCCPQSRRQVVTSFAKVLSLKWQKFVDGRDCHLLDDLGGAGKGALRAVQVAFNGIYRSLVTIIQENSCHDLCCKFLKLDVLRALAIKLIPSHPEVSLFPEEGLGWRDEAFAPLADSGLLTSLGALLANPADILRPPVHPIVPGTGLKHKTGIAAQLLGTEANNPNKKENGSSIRKASVAAGLDSVGSLNLNRTLSNEKRQVLMAQEDTRPMHHATWNLLFLVALQLCADDSSKKGLGMNNITGHPQSPAGLSRKKGKPVRGFPSTSWETAVEAVFDVVFHELSRVYKKLEDFQEEHEDCLLQLKELSTQPILQRPIPLGQSSTFIFPDAIDTKNSKLGSCSFDFWLWLSSENRSTEEDEGVLTMGDQKSNIFLCGRLRQDADSTPHPDMELCSQPGVFLTEDKSTTDSHSEYLLEFVSLGQKSKPSLQRSSSRSPNQEEEDVEPEEDKQPEKVMKVKAKLKTGRWTHVCCVYSNGMKGTSNQSPEKSGRKALAHIRIYVNGELVDEKDYAERTDKKRLIYTEIVVGNSGATGFSGAFLSDLNWHPVVMSRPQAKKLFNMGVPSQRKGHHGEVDRYCSSILSLLQSVSFTKHSMPLISQGGWVLLLRLLQVCGPSSQRLGLSLFRSILPRIPQSSLNSSPSLTFESLNESGEWAAGSAVKVVSAARKGGVSSVMEHLTFLFGNTTFAFTKVAKDGILASSFSEDVDAASGLGSSEFSLVGPTNRFSFVSELVILFRLLIQTSGWREAVTSALFSELSQVPSRLPAVVNLITPRLTTPRDQSGAATTTPRRPGSASPFSQTQRRSTMDSKESIRQLGAALAAIYVYGGHVEGVRIGAQVILHSGTKVTVDGKLSVLPCNCRGVIVSLTSPKAQHVVVSPNDDFRGCVKFNEKDHDSHPLLTVSVHKLVFEESSEHCLSPPLLNNESLVSFSYLLNTQPCLDLVDGSMMEATLKNKEGVYDSLLISSHVRTRALLALVRQVAHPGPAFSVLQGGLLPALLALATTDLDSVAGIALGKEANTLKKMPLLGALVNTLSKAKMSIQDLQLFSMQVWSRFPDTSPLSRSPWWLGNIGSMHRGKQALEVLGGDVAVEGWRLRAKSQFPTIRLGGVSLGKGYGVDRGIWFYEATLLTEGLMQVGWADSAFICDPIRGQGVGDHTHSWAYDGYRQKKWSVSSQTYGERWRIGDTVGVLINLDLVEMRFYINGKDLGPAFVGFKAEGLYPALSLNAGQACRFNFGQSDFLYPPSVPFKPVCEATSTTAIMTPQKLPNNPSMQDYESARLDDTRRRQEEEPDEELATEIEMRRQALIENLIGMGFPVEWAIRAAEHCDASLNESVAISWIIERMELENAKMEAEAEAASEGLGQGGRLGGSAHPSARFGDDEYEAEGEDEATESNLSFGLRSPKSAPSAGGAGTKLTAVDEEVGNNAAHADDVSLLEDDSILGSGSGSDNPNYFLPEKGDSGLWKQGEEGNSAKADQEKLCSQVSSAAAEELVAVALVTDAALAVLYARAACAQLLGHTRCCSSVPYASVSPASLLAQQQKECFQKSVLMSRHNSGNVPYFIEDVKEEQNIRAQLLPILVKSMLEVCPHSKFIDLTKLLTFRSSLSSDLSEDQLRAAIFGPGEDPTALLMAATDHAAPPLKALDLSRHTSVKDALNLGTLEPFKYGRPVLAHFLNLLVDPWLLVEYMITTQQQNQDMGKSSATPISLETALKMAPAVITAFIEEALAQFEKARLLKDMAVKELGGGTDKENTEQPNIPWAVWVLQTIMHHLEAKEEYLTEPHSKASKANITPETAALLPQVKQAAEAVFSPVVFKSLLNAAQLRSVTARRLAFDLCCRVLHWARHHLPPASNPPETILTEGKASARVLGTAGPASASPEPLSPGVVTPGSTDSGFEEVKAINFDEYLAISREKVLMHHFSKRVQKEGATRVLHSPYLQGLSNLLLQWQLLRNGLGMRSEILALTEEQDPSSSKEHLKQGSPMALTVEETTSTSITLSWGGWIQEEGLLRTMTRRMSGRSGARHRYALQMSVVSAWGEDPHTICNSDLGEKGCFSVEGLEPDTMYRFRLVELVSLNSASGVSFGGGKESAASLKRLSLHQARTQRTLTLGEESESGVNTISSPNIALGKVTGGDAGDTVSLFSRGDHTLLDDADDASLEGGETAGGLSTSYDSLRPMADPTGDTATIATFASNRSGHTRYGETPVGLTRFGDLGPCLNASTLQETIFMVDPDGVGSNLQLLNGNMTVVNTVNKKWNACRATTCFTSGVHHWEVNIDKCVSKNIFIGVMAADGSLDNYVGSDKYGWGYLANKAIWHNKGKIRSYGELFREGDRISIHLDMDVGTLWFARNGRDLGSAVEGLIGPLYPAFSMYNKDDQLSLIPPDSSGSSSQSSGGSCSAEALIQQLALSVQFLELPRMHTSASSNKLATSTSSSKKAGGSTSEPDLGDRMTETTPSPFDPWSTFTVTGVLGTGAPHEVAGGSLSLSSGGYTGPSGWTRAPLLTRPNLMVNQDFPVAMVNRILSRLRQWERGTSVRVTTGQGNIMYVDSARSACESFGMFPGDRIIVNKGIAIVLGTARHCLWYRLEGKEEAAFWNRREVKDMLTKPGEYSLQKNTQNIDDMVIPGAAEANSITASQIIEWFRNWTPELDEELCTYLNVHGDLNNTTPFGIPYKALSCQPPATTFPRLAEKTIIEIRCRAAFLFCLNDALAPVLPLLDLTTIGNHHSPAYPLAQWRAILFNCTKASLFDSLLEHTAPTSQEPKDEISEQAELLKFNVNLDDVEDIGDGLQEDSWVDQNEAIDRMFFGQASAQITQADLSDLRKNMAFEVFFEPQAIAPAFPLDQTALRQILMWKVCEELRAGPCPLLAPTVNSMAEQHAESGQDPTYCVSTRFCLAPVKDPIGLDALRLVRYRQLGQLMGLAIRSGVAFPIQVSALLWKLLASQDLTREDLLEMDREASGVAVCFQYMNDLGLNPDSFQDLMAGVNFIAPLNNGEIIELFPGGRNRQVHWEETEMFATQLEQIRLLESTPQIAAIYAGLTSVIPRHLLSLFTWKELEVLVCGRGVRKLIYLKRCSAYEEGINQSDQHIQMFWNVLEDFRIETRTIFLETLNLDSTNTPLRFVQPPSHIAERADEHFPLIDPLSHTIALPPYSTQEIMKGRLLRLLQSGNELSSAPTKSDVFEEYLNAYC